MTSIKYLVALCALAAVCLAGEDDHHLHCHLDGHEEVHLHAGEEQKHPEKCQQIFCIDPDTDKFEFKSCPPIPKKGGCRVTDEDNSKPFPDCCSQLVC